MHGVVVIDKPLGITSHDCVTKVKKLLKVKKAGHAGTLDPLATGVLPVCLGEATKAAHYLIAGDKEYRVTMLLGVETDTLDREGRVTKETPLATTEEEIHMILPSFVGSREQQPPYYSAVKYQGQPLYRWARQGVKVDVPPRRIEIYALQVEAVALPYVQFHVACSAGTYVRVLCAELGRALRCGGCLVQLRRLRAGPFSEEHAVPLTEGGMERHVIPLPEALAHMPAITVSPLWVERLKQGQQPTEATFEGSDISSLDSGLMIKVLSQTGEMVALARLEPMGRARIVRIFHNRGEN